MVLSKREQIILLTAVVAVGLLIGNKFVYEPIRDKLATLNDAREELRKELDSAHLLIAKKKRDEPKYKRLTTEGFQDEADVDNKVSTALNEWSQKYGLKTSSTRPERVPSDKELQEMRFTFSGTGTLKAAASFLWEIESAPMPIKITSMTLSSSSDSGDQMSLTLGVSAVYPGTAQKKRPANAAETKGNEDEI
jgi:hypothetical protein